MESTKKDFRISILIGFIAGLLLLPTLRNIGIELSWQIGILAVFGLTILTPLGYLVAYWLSRWLPIMIQFVKFGIVGGLNFTIDLGILNLLIYFSGITLGFYYSLFKALSFLIAVINSYVWNKYWTFKVADTPGVGEITKFFVVNIIGFGINVSLASFVVNVIGAPADVSGEVWANIGAVAASMLALTWNFIGMKFIVFKK